LQDLLAETPSNILSQEVLFASADASHWYSLVKSLTESVAVMSVIGYILGLGDRHLDNLLFDINQGMRNLAMPIFFACHF
jgi:PI-3-kinase-related kinase SMG-1